MNVKVLERDKYRFKPVTIFLFDYKFIKYIGDTSNTAPDTDQATGSGYSIAKNTPDRFNENFHHK